MLCFYNIYFLNSYLQHGPIELRDAWSVGLIENNESEAAEGEHEAGGQALHYVLWKTFNQSVIRTVLICISEWPYSMFFTKKRNFQTIVQYRRFIRLFLVASLSVDPVLHEGDRPGMPPLVGGRPHGGRLHDDVVDDPSSHQEVR